LFRRRAIIIERKKDIKIVNKFKMYNSEPYFLTFVTILILCISTVLLHLWYN